MLQKRLIKHIEKLLKKKIKQQYVHEQNRNLSEPERQMLVNHIKNGGAKKVPTNFSPAISRNVEICRENCLTLSFVLTLFPHWCKISGLYLVSVPSYWAWVKTFPQKKCFSGQIWGYDNFYPENTRVTKLWSHDYNIIRFTRKKFVGDIMDRKYDVITFISK